MVEHVRMVDYLLLQDEIQESPADVKALLGYRNTLLRFNPMNLNSYRELLSKNGPEL